MSSRVIGICMAGVGHEVDTGFLSMILGWNVNHGRAVLRGNTVVAVRADEIGGPPRWLPVVLQDPNAGPVEPGRARPAGIDGVDVVIDNVGAEYVVTRPGTEFSAPLTSDAYVASERRPGRVSFVQLNSPEPHVSAAYYRAALGWDERVSNNDRFNYRYLGVEGEPHTGLLTIDERSGPVVPGWQCYVHSDDVYGSGTSIVRAGGTLLVEPMTIVNGDFLVGRTPGGAVFALDDMTRTSRSS